VVLATLQRDELTWVVVTLWAIWFARRKGILENIFRSPLSTHSFVERFITDLNLISLGRKQQGSGKTTSSGWIPPPAGVTKINVDAAISKDSGRGAVAAIVRDEAANFMEASALFIAGILEPETMEAIACREGLSLASDLQLNKVKLASDCANVVRCILEEAMGSYSHVVREIKARMADFQEFKIVHEGRRANVDAHMLARGALGTDVVRHVWFLNPPDGVCNLVRTNPV
jgi:ribonuclease HI